MKDLLKNKIKTLAGFKVFSYLCKINHSRIGIMTKEELIDRINDIEWEDFEAKEAKSELPKNVWETVGAFANSSGGWIVLGIKQTGKKFEVTGVDNAEKLEQDFLGTLRSQKFNEPLLTNGYLEQTIPDKPSSPKQQYRTTRSGLIFLESI